MEEKLFDSFTSLVVSFFPRQTLQVLVWFWSQGFAESDCDSAVTRLLSQVHHVQVSGSESDNHVACLV